MSPSRPSSRQRRGASSLVCAALALSLACLWASPAIAANLGNSFNELTKSQPETATTPTVRSTSSESTKTSTSKALLFVGFGGAAALLGGIAFLIVRDARRVAPAGDADLIEARSRHDTAARVRRRRARAKAARQQRKRNR
ncbi:MAG TPA: hypothetical protein VNZ05_09990 [Solirubrobacteraceae bacterium]|nr:hypothetical protein [Solirubrobacteraceae bacterium]